MSFRYARLGDEASISITYSFQSNESACGTHRLKNGESYAVCEYDRILRNTGTGVAIHEIIGISVMSPLSQHSRSSAKSNLQRLNFAVSQPKILCANYLFEAD